MDFSYRQKTADPTYGLWWAKPRSMQTRSRKRVVKRVVAVAVGETAVSAEDSIKVHC